MGNILRRIKNWLDFQHYHTGKNAKMQPEWIKLYHKLLDDIEWHELEPKASKLLINLWLLASENGGVLPPIKTIAFRLRLPEREIQTLLAKLPHWIEEEPLPRKDTNSLPRPDKEEEGDIEEKKKENEKSALSREFAESFWPLYPNRVGKPKALDAFLRARRSHPLDAILRGLQNYKRSKPPDRQWLNPATFLNQERFLDEPAQVASGPPRGSRTVIELDAFVEEVRNRNGTSRTGICGQSGEPAYPQLPDSTERPQDLCEPTDDALHRKAASGPEGYG